MSTKLYLPQLLTAQCKAPLQSGEMKHECLSRCSKKPMTWAEEQNDILIDEIYLFEPWKYKKGSKERGEMCKKTVIP